MASKEQEKEAGAAGAEGATGAAGAAGADSHLRRQLQTMALGRSASDPRSQTDILESWFNDGMERVSGWYKRRMQVVTLIVAAVLTVLTNADTLRAAAILWTNPTIRAAAVEQARVRAATPLPEAPTLQATYSNTDNPTPVGEKRSSAEFKERVEGSAAGATTEAVDTSALTLFIGWTGTFRQFNDRYCARRQLDVNARCGTSAPATNECQALVDELARDARCQLDGTTRLGTNQFPGWAPAGSPLIFLSAAVTHSIGWLLTIVAVSLGAPFWFDLLQRFVRVRGSGPTPVESAKAKDKAEGTRQKA